jgi:hypothetical protein
MKTIDRWDVNDVKTIVLKIKRIRRRAGRGAGAAHRKHTKVQHSYKYKQEIIII